MNDQQRVDTESIGRSVTWLLGAGLDIPSVLNTKALALQVTHNEILGAAASLEAAKGTSSEEFGGKGGDRELLRNKVFAIKTMAEAMTEDFPDIDLLFQVRRNLNDQDLLATARAFATNAAAHSADFIAWGMPAAFIAELTAAADAFQADIASAGDAFGDKVGLTAFLKQMISKSMQQKRTIGGMVKIQFASDVAALAAWNTASQVEARPHHTTPPATPPSS
jgi:hypothetical protein